jgi:hypothetical protein
MIFVYILTYLLFCFFGFAVGRAADRFLGHMNGFHHWIWGVLTAVVGFVFYSCFSKWYVLVMPPFGLGLFISDLEDFLHFKIWGKDTPHEWKFWSIK